jgi:DNA-binding beta-propeller fold protein YncE
VVSPDGKWVYVVNTLSRTVSVISADLTNLQPRSFEVEKGPVDVKITPDGRRVLVVNEQSHSLFIGDLHPAEAAQK